MDKIVIEGGIPLRGEVLTSGSKNACLPILAATLLCPGVHQVANVPDLHDVLTLMELFTLMGASWERQGDRLLVDTRNLHSWEAPYDLVRKMRASIVVLGALMTRFGRARVSLPGGCAIGTRPVDLHLRALSAMGARVTIDQGYIDTNAPQGLRGASLYLDFPTVTGTENILLAAVCAEGETVIENAAREPEVVDLANALRAMGADIEGAGTTVIRVRGVRELCPLDYRVIPDRIEAGTFLIAGAITRGQVTVRGCEPRHLHAVTLKLREIGVHIEEGPDWIAVDGDCPQLGTQITTLVYPGFPTDLQAQFMALLCLARGTSIIRETIFENRFMHAAELARAGARITTDGAQAVIEPVAELQGAPLMATDLRASACLVLAGLAAKGHSEILRVYHLDRGYERIEQKLGGLGASITRRKDTHLF